MVWVHFWSHLDISQTCLPTCAVFEGWGFIAGAVQDPARVHGVLGLGPPCNLTKMANLKICPQFYHVMPALRLPILAKEQSL